MNLRIGFFQTFAPIYDWLHFSRSGKTLTALDNELKLNPTDVVLDLAGGTGRIAKKIQNKVKKIFIVDASPRMLRVAERRQLRCVHGFAEKIPFPNGFFNKIIIVDALHHFQDLESAILEIKRVLNNDGKLFVEEVNPQGKFGRMLKFAEKVLRMNSHFHSPFELETIFMRHFDRVNCRDTNKSFYNLVARK